MSSPRKNVPSSAAGSHSDLKPGFTYNELWETMVDELRGVDIEPGDKTVKMLVAESGCSPNTASKRLNEMVERGEMVFMGYHKVGSAKEKVYRPAGS